ncbi:hypothetical protein EE612_051921, partial [Oryza sativa]
MPPPPHNPPAVFWRFPYKLTRCLDPSGSAVDTYAHPPRPLPSKPNPNPPTLIHFTPPSRYKIPPKLNPTLNSKPKPPHTLRFFFPFHFFLLLLRCFRFSLERRVCDGRAERWRRGDVDGRGAPAVRAAAAAARGGGGGAGRGGGYMGDVVGVVVARGGVPARWWRPADACGGGVVEGREGEARWRRRRGGEGGRWWRWGRGGGGGVAAGEHPRLVEDPRHGVRRQGERGRSRGAVAVGRARRRRGVPRGLGLGPAARAPPLPGARRRVLLRPRGRRPHAQGPRPPPRPQRHLGEDRLPGLTPSSSTTTTAAAAAVILP